MTPVSSVPWHPFFMTRLEIGLNVAIVAVTDEEPRVLTVREPRVSAGEPALPFGRLDPEGDRTLELGLRGWVRDQTGLELGYVEQLYTFGDRDRRPPPEGESARVISVAYLALVREEEPAPEADAAWRGVYDFLPWEDFRHGPPRMIDRQLTPALQAWAGAKPAARRARYERAEIAFGLGGAGWDEERVLDRYELLFEAGVISEASGIGAGRSMAMDHRRMLATALGRLRGKLKYRPVVFELLPTTFTLLQLQRVVEALSGRKLHKQNFRRLVERARLVEGTGKQDSETGGRPAELFSFRRDVLRERPAPGVGLPGLPSG